MTPLEQIIISELPAAIRLVRSAFVKQNPDLPPPTDAEVIAVYESGYLSSVAKDDRIISEHSDDINNG